MRFDQQTENPFPFSSAHWCEDCSYLCRLIGWVQQTSSRQYTDGLQDMELPLVVVIILTWFLVLACRHCRTASHCYCKPCKISA